MKLIFSASLLFFSFSLLAQSIKGGVEDIDTKQSVPFAKVVFVDLGYVVKADSLGIFIIDDIPTGQHRVEVTALGYETIITEIDFQINELSKIYITKNHHEFDKVIVSNNGFLQRESITNVESHQISELDGIPSNSLGTTIANIPGVSQLNTGAGISKPVIRGLSGSSVVTYINGLRIQNQQWGTDHGLPITSLGIGAVEVIKGPSSLLYGADALGGVLYFVDEAYAPKGQTQGFVSTRFESNTLGSSNQFGVKFSKNNLRVNIYGGYDNHADSKMPDSLYLVNSRFSQTAGKVSIGYNHKNWVMNLRYNFYDAWIGLPGESEDSVVTPYSFQSLNQGRERLLPTQKIQNHFLSLENKFFLGKQELSITLGNTNNSTKEFEEGFGEAAVNMNLNNSLFNLKWRNTLTENLTFIAGSQGMYQLNKNALDAEEMLIPDANTADIGLYSLLHYKFKKWSFQGGGRIDNRIINAQDSINFSANYLGLNYSAGMARIGKTSTIRFNVSSGFRAPNTSELLANGVHHGAMRYELGNATLKTEKAVQIDASFGLHFDDLELIFNPFYNRIQDYIYLESSDTIIDGYTAYNYTQANYAQLYGLEVGVHYHPHFAHWIHVESNFSNVFAEDENKQALPLIPQSNTNTRLRFESNMEGKLRVENVMLQHQYFFKQNRIGLNETESQGFYLVNAGLNLIYDIKTPLYISLGMRNLFDSKFVNHLSTLKPLGITAPGINFYASVKWAFGQE